VSPLEIGKLGQCNFAQFRAFDIVGSR